MTNQPLAKKQFEKALKVLDAQFRVNDTISNKVLKQEVNNVFKLLNQILKDRGYHAPVETGKHPMLKDIFHSEKAFTTNTDPKVEEYLRIINRVGTEVDYRVLRNYASIPFILEGLAEEGESNTVFYLVVIANGIHPFLTLETAMYTVVLLAVNEEVEQLASLNRLVANDNTRPNITLTEELPTPRFIKMVKAYHGVTTKQLAEKVGVAYATIANLENGKATMSEKTAVKFEIAYGYDHEILLEYHGKPRITRGTTEQEE